MNTVHINHYLRYYKNFFGTYPKDLLPHKIPYCTGVVINTDKASDPGEHWVAVYLNDRGVAEYFDSFGFLPLHKEIIEFLDRISPIGWHYNSVMFQSVYSDTCGNYCVYYLANRFNGGDLESFRKIFIFAPKINDKIAKILYKTCTTFNK